MCLSSKDGNNAMSQFSILSGSCRTTDHRSSVALRNTVKLAAFVLLLLVAMPGESSAAVSANVRNACMNDYFRLCSYTGGNVSRASRCMRANYSRLSKRCKAATSRSKKAKRSRRR
jgi:hypothetical protein